jgi:hypothetical protein
MYNETATYFEYKEILTKKQDNKETKAQKKITRETEKDRRKQMGGNHVVQKHIVGTLDNGYLRSIPLPLVRQNLYHNPMAREAWVSH